MRWRILAGVLAVGALWAPAAGADPYADYNAVRADWQPDQVITACRFTIGELQNARSLLTGEDNYSGFQEALETEISRQRSRGCPGGGGTEGRPALSRVKVVAGRVQFGLSRAAQVGIVVERRAGRGWVRVRGLTRAARAGSNTISLPLRGLAAGSYRVTVTARAGGEKSAPARASFPIRR